MLERGAVGVDLREVEADALEELAGHRVGVLVGVEDVGAVAVEQLRERRDDAPLVGTRDEQRGDGVGSGVGTARRAVERLRQSRKRSSQVAAPPDDLIN